MFIAGAAVHPFGKHQGKPADELGYLAVSELMATAGVDPGQVGVGFGGSMYGGSLLAQRVLQRVGISGQPVFTVENACASGASAVHLAWQAVAVGFADCAVAFGAENLSSFGGGTLPLTTNDIEIAQGMVMPAAYAMRAQRYLHDWGAAVEDLTNVSVKNRRNGAANPRAHFQKRDHPGRRRGLPSGRRPAASAALLPQQRRRGRGGAVLRAVRPATGRSSRARRRERGAVGTILDRLPRHDVAGHHRTDGARGV